MFSIYFNFLVFTASKLFPWILCFVMNVEFITEWKIVIANNGFI